MRIKHTTAEALKWVKNNAPLPCLDVKPLALAEGD
jgi:hypothetical protein